MRKHFIDNIRWATVVLVLVYHVFYMFNGVGILGGIPGSANIAIFDRIACAIYPWFMVLLFVVAGISARYALQKRTGGQFIKDRAVKLLVPSTLGLFVVHWVTGYLNIKMGGALGLMPGFMVYPISVISGIGPLWFIQMLFVFSCALVLLKKLDRADRVWRLCGRANLPVLLLLAVVIFAAAQVLNMPVLTMYRFGIYFAAFLIGYYVFSHGAVQDIAARACVPMACAAAVGAVAYAIDYGAQNFTEAACLQSVFTNVYLWIVVLAVLGCGKRFFDRETALSRCMTRASFGLYILHYPILLTVSYMLHTRLSLPAICNYAIALVLEFVLTFAAFEIVRRIPVIRFLVLGMRKERA